MQISYFAVMDNPEDEAAINTELVRLRRIEQAARTCLDFYNNVLRDEKQFATEAAMFDELETALESK